MQDQPNQIVSRGMRFPDDPQIITASVAKKLRREKYETPEITGLEKFVQPKDRVLELGGGIGYISTFIAKFLNVQAITVVEANTKLCSYIQQVHAANDVAHVALKNGVALPDAAHDEPSLPSDHTIPFYITDPFWSSSMIAPAKASDAIRVDVPAFRLSDLVASFKPTIIVCDIEGGEVELFEQVDLTGVNYIYLELHTRVTGAHGVVRVFEAMHRHRFFYHQRVSRDGVVLFQRY